jgi:replicative DNA helicase
VTGRRLPHNVDAEASILGGIILRNEVLSDLDTIEVADFYDHRHKVVFQAIRNLEAALIPIDVVTIENEIARAGKLEAIGGPAFMGELALRVPTVENVVAYADIVKDKSTKRKLALLGADITERALADDTDADEVLGQVQESAARLDRADPDGATSTIATLLDRRIKQLVEIAEQRAAGHVALTGIPTGIADLDAQLGGWQRGIVNMLAARPSMGKTATTITSAAAASRAGFPVHVFGLEDSWQAVADRWLSRESQIPAVQLRQGLVDRAQVAALFDAGNRLRSRVNVLMDGRAALSATEIVRTVRRFLPKHQTQLVIVDYVQLVRRRAGLSENEALDEIATMFSDAAKADDVAYLVTSQLNRECEKRDDKRPQLSDLRGSGALEERAKVAVGQYRGVYYYDRPRRGIDYDCECPSSVTGGCVHAPSTDRFASTVQLIVLKNSNGPTGPVFARWNGPTMEVW